MTEHDYKTLKIKDLGIDTYRENIIYMRSDCAICKSEGFTALTRIEVSCREKTIIATLNVVYSDIIHHFEAGLSIEAIQELDAKDGDFVTVAHLRPIPSVGLVRAKMYGKELTAVELDEIISDISKGFYSNIEIAAFIAASSGKNLSIKEITGLTESMVRSGERLHWEEGRPVYDKHCIGGLPGNRTTPIIVSIAAAAGFTIPKTSSKSITSPSGSADTLQVMTNVNISLDKMKEIVEKENGCLAWGGSVGLSPVDDILISIEKSLDIDSEGQMIASVLSKKLAAGSTHVIIDVPVGKSAKVRSHEDALKLKGHFEQIASNLGLKIKVLLTDGSQPVGQGIGPSLEAIDVLSVLRNDKDASQDLRTRALTITGELLELSDKFRKGTGYAEAARILESGAALEKFMAICEAQGRFTEPTFAANYYDVISTKDGIVREIDCRRLAKIAKLAGAPKSAKAGIWYLSPLNKKIEKGTVLFRIYAETQGELSYAIDYYQKQNEIISIR